MLKALQNRTKPCALVGGVDVEHPGHGHRLVGHKSDRTAGDPSEAHDDVGGEPCLDLQEVTQVCDLDDDLADVITLLGIIGMISLRALVALHIVMVRG